MKKLFALFWDPSFLKFLLVGGCNMIISMAIMFLLYTAAGLGYWGASALSFALCSVSSYIFNRKFSFRSNAPLLPSILKFSAVIAACYLIAFGMAKPLMLWFVGLVGLSWTAGVTEQVSMVLAQGIFTVLNFLGQRLWAFRKEEPI